METDLGGITVMQSFLHLQMFVEKDGCSFFIRLPELDNFALFSIFPSFSLL